MAYIEARKRGDGSTVYRVVWYTGNTTPSGRPEKDSMGQWDDRKHAEEFKAVFEAAGNNVADTVAAFEAAKKQTLTVAQMVETHISLLTGIEASTRQNYQRMAGHHIAPIIGALPADTIERDRIREWINQVSTPDPVRIGSALAQARKESDLSRDHLAARLGWETKKVTGYETGRVPLDKDGLAAVFTALRLPRVQRLLLTTVAYGMGAKTLRNVHSLLSAAFTWANSERKLRGDNPAKNIRLPEYTPAEMTFLTPAEFGMLLARFTEPYQLMVRFLAGTGARWGELIALTVGDVHLDVEHPYVSINKAIKRRPGGHYSGSPKSTRSRRSVSLPLSLVDPLRALIGDREESDWLFRGPLGGRIHYGNFYNDHWVPAIKAVTATHTPDGTPISRERRITKTSIRIHDLRHTHASWLIARGVDLPTVQRRLGHESITTTVDRYGHLDPHQLQAAAKAADAALAGTGAPVDPLPDVLAPVIDLDAERAARAGASAADPAAGSAPAAGPDPFTGPAADGTSEQAAPAAPVAWAVGAAGLDVPEDLARTILGDELQRARKRRGWTQAQLAEAVPFDLHMNTLRGYERGAVALTVSRFIQLVTFMGAPAGQVLDQAMRRIFAARPTGGPGGATEAREVGVAL